MTLNKILFFFLLLTFNFNALAVMSPYRHACLVALETQYVIEFITPENAASYIQSTVRFKNIPLSEEEINLALKTVGQKYFSGLSMTNLTIFKGELRAMEEIFNPEDASTAISLVSQLQAFSHQFNARNRALKDIKELHSNLNDQLFLPHRLEQRLHLILLLIKLREIENSKNEYLIKLLDTFKDPLAPPMDIQVYIAGIQLNIEINLFYTTITDEIVVFKDEQERKNLLFTLNFYRMNNDISLPEIYDQIISARKRSSQPLKASDLILLYSPVRSESIQ
ncbi:MAG: hypothetical protein H6625_00180 [Bdellovibrionaceae bacterium]|nr:hypothetical protein [Pseudobdellovibrionaceae bacterium]